MYTNAIEPANAVILSAIRAWLYAARSSACLTRAGLIGFRGRMGRTHRCSGPAGGEWTADWAGSLGVVFIGQSSPEFREPSVRWRRGCYAASPRAGRTVARCARRSRPRRLAAAGSTVACRRVHPMSSSAVSVGCSSGTAWPASCTTCSSAPGMPSASSSALATGTIASRPPWRTSVGARTRAKRPAATEARGRERLRPGHPWRRAVTSEVGHVRGHPVRVLVPEAAGEQGGGGPGCRWRTLSASTRPERAGRRGQPRPRGRRTAGASADQDEALDAVRHPDRQLERDRRAHRQPDHVRAGDAAIVQHACARRWRASPSRPARATARSDRRRGGRRRRRGRAARRGRRPDRTRPRRSSSP